MPYPLCKSTDRLCRDLFRRQIQRVQDFWDRGGYCTRCHKRNCFDFSCIPKVHEQPKVTHWDTSITPRTKQAFNNVPPYSATHYIGKPRLRE
jgi:hypothetical protein